MHMIGNYIYRVYMILILYIYTYMELHYQLFICQFISYKKLHKINTFQY